MGRHLTIRLAGFAWSDCPIPPALWDRPGDGAAPCFNLRSGRICLARTEAATPHTAVAVASNHFAGTDTPQDRSSHTSRPPDMWTVTSPAEKVADLSLEPCGGISSFHQCPLTRNVPLIVSCFNHAVGIAEIVFQL